MTDTPSDIPVEHEVFGGVEQHRAGTGGNRGIETALCGACGHPLTRITHPLSDDKPEPWSHVVESSSQSGHTPVPDPELFERLTPIPLTQVGGIKPGVSTLELLLAREARASIALDRDPRAETQSVTSDPDPVAITTTTPSTTDHDGKTT